MCATNTWAMHVIITVIIPSSAHHKQAKTNLSLWLSRDYAHISRIFDRNNDTCSHEQLLPGLLEVDDVGTFVTNTMPLQTVPGQLRILASTKLTFTPSLVDILQHLEVSIASANMDACSKHLRDIGLLEGQHIKSPGHRSSVAGVTVRQTKHTHTQKEADNTDNRTKWEMKWTKQQSKLTRTRQVGDAQQKRGRCDQRMRDLCLAVVAQGNGVSHRKVDAVFSKIPGTKPIRPLLLSCFSPDRFIFSSCGQREGLLAIKLPMAGNDCRLCWKRSFTPQNLKWSIYQVCDCGLHIK